MAITTRISSGRGASATDTVIVSKCGNDQESSLCPSGTSSKAPAAATLTFDPMTAFPPPIAARIGLPSIGWTQAPAMLHFASNTNDRAFAIRDGGSVEQFHQLWHEALSEHCTRLEQRS